MSEVVAGGIIEKDGKYLLVKENKGQWKGTWNLPAGSLDEHESVLEGACREVFEETGCLVEVVGIIDIFNRIYDNVNIVAFLFDMKLKKENVCADGKEISDVKWFTYDEIVSMKDQLRADAFFVNSLKKKEKDEVLPLDVITINKCFKKNS